MQRLMRRVVTKELTWLGERYFFMEYQFYSYSSDSQFGGATWQAMAHVRLVP